MRSNVLTEERTTNAEMARNQMQRAALTPTSEPLGRGRTAQCGQRRPANAENPFGARIEFIDILFALS